MPDQTVPTPEPLPPRPLSPSARRALAAAMLGTATGAPPYVSSMLIDALDHATWAVLATAGASPAEAVQILASLWVTE